MNSIHHRRSTCRLCESSHVECAFRLEPSALAESYLPPEQAKAAEERYPLDLFRCLDCGHVQLFDVIDPVRLFAHYSYQSSWSPGLDYHFKRYADDVVARFQPHESALVVDVGSNDGTLLKYFARPGLRVLGVEPSEKIANVARARGVPTMVSFMDGLAVETIVQYDGQASICTANNVFAHNDNLGAMADSIRNILAPDGVFVFEVSNLLDTVQGMVFDFIYHEHLSYHSVKPLDLFLYRHGMRLFDVERVPMKGGSLRCFAQKISGPHPVSPRVAEYVAKEQAAGLYDAQTYRDFIACINHEKDKLRLFLQQCRDSDLEIAGYGASATVTTLLHHFQIGDLMSFLVDDNPNKQGTVSPGFKIPVFSPNVLDLEHGADVIVILAWRFVDQIIARHPNYLSTGKIVAVPLPTLAIHE